MLRSQGTEHAPWTNSEQQLGTFAPQPALSTFSVQFLISPWVSLWSWREVYATATARHYPVPHPDGQEPLLSSEVPVLCLDSQSVTCVWNCTNQCFENNDLKLSKLNFKKFDRLPYRVGLLLESHAVEMLKSAYRTQSLDVLFLFRNNLFKAVSIAPLCARIASEAAQPAALHTHLAGYSLFSFFL